MQTHESFAAGTADRAQPAEIWKARRFIEEQIIEKLSLGKVAQVVRMSPNYLSEKFKHVTGENFVAYVNRRRVEKAIELIHQPDLRISEIGFAVGFQSLSQFNRVFRQLTGGSPSNYRLELPTCANGVHARQDAQVPAHFSRREQITSRSSSSSRGNK